MKKALVIKVFANGVVEVTRVPFETGSLDFYYDQINCDCIDIVHGYGLSIDADIIIDDEGLFKEKPIVNPVASIAYGALEHGQPIVGNAIICKPHETTDGIDETGFTDKEIDLIMNEITGKLMGMMSK